MTMVGSAGWTDRRTRGAGICRAVHQPRAHTAITQCRLARRRNHTAAGSRSRGVLGRTHTRPRKAAARRVAVRALVADLGAPPPLFRFSPLGASSFIAHTWRRCALYCIRQRHCPCCSRPCRWGDCCRAACTGSPGHCSCAWRREW
jgi:hypothetical protein